MRLPFKIEQRHLRVVTRRFWATVFTCVIGMAVVVQLGRQAFPLLNDYQHEITRLMGRSLGVDITVASIEASWSGLRPKLSMRALRASAADGTVIFTVEHATAELGLLATLAQGRFSWRQLVFEGLRAGLQQSPEGRWALQGMDDYASTSQARDDFKFDDPYDLFVFCRRVSISDARFDLSYASGQQSRLSIPNIAIENDSDFHRLQASMDLAADRRVMSVLVEGHGDPRDTDFVANGYVELTQFPTQSLIDAFAIGGLSSGEEGHSTDLRLWFRSDADKGTTLRGHFTALGDLHSRRTQWRLPSKVQGQFHGRAQRHQGWAVTLQALQMAWPQRSAEAMTVAVEGDLRGVQTLRVQSLDIGTWAATALDIGLPDAEAQKMLAALRPRGELRNVELKLLPAEAGHFQLSAHLVNGASDAILGAPAFENLDGYFSLTREGGFMNVAVDDGLTIALPKVYHEPLFFARASGQLRWHIDRQRRVTYLSSGHLKVVNPEEEANGYLHLILPFTKQDGEQSMTLALGIKHTLARNHKKYVPKTIPRHLYRWLDTSVKEGRVTNARFLYHGSVHKDPAVPPSIQLAGEVHDGNLVFDPSWPELQGVRGSLNLENEHLDVRIDQATLLGNSVYDAAIQLVEDPAIEGRGLSIKGSLAADAQTAMTLLKNSPIKQHIGSTFDTWALGGGVGAKVELLVPLNSASPGFSHKIEVRFADASVRIPEINLGFSGLDGTLHYQTGKGMFARRLRGQLWGERFDANVASPLNASGGRDTHISFTGAVNMAALTRWTQRPELRFASGRSTISGEFFIPTASEGQPMSIHLSSTLRGTAIDLPVPVGKAADEDRQFNARVRFFPGAEEYYFQLGDVLDVSLLSAREAPLSAVIGINRREQHQQLSSPLPQSGRFDIDGHLAELDLDAWNSVKARYDAYADAMLPAAPAVEVPARFHLGIDRFLLGNFAIDTLDVVGRREERRWTLKLASQLMAGEVQVPEDASPIRLKLDYLRFAAVEADEDAPSPGAERSSVLADVELARAIPLDFSTREFSLGEANYGSWDFKLRPVAGGIRVQDIIARSRGMRLGSPGQGATFTWLQDEQGQRSSFSGSLRADDLADVFSAWGQERLVTSKSALIDIDARWPGAPDQVSLQNVTGSVRLDIAQGSFARGAGSDENALLRLIALFNFDTILRRLRLDFSDLAAQGYAFDSLVGEMEFRGGTAYLTEPMIVDSSSSFLQLAGSVDMVAEELDTEMVVTLPVASNAAVATALVVGLPAALGVYVMGKLFKKQVDRASSINLDVTGSWAEPKIKVKKIFDIDAASRRSQQTREAQSEGSATAPSDPTEE